MRKTELQNIKKYIAISTALIFLLTAMIALADQNLAQKLSGRILLQVQSHGEAWYLNPANYKKYYLDRPADAFNLMRNLGIGITDANLKKIPIGFMEYNGQDDDNDGLVNRLENALGTNPNKKDTDNDGYNDESEIKMNYDPLSTSSLMIDKNFVNQNLGKIFLQIEKLGEAWYVNPADQKRYYLGRPADAFTIMRQLCLGITNNNLDLITTGYFITPSPLPKPSPPCTNCQNQSPAQVFAAAAAAIRGGRKTEAASYFIPEMAKAVEYTIDFLDAEGRLVLGNIMSGAKLSDSSESEVEYSTEVYFSLGGYKVPIHFYVKKQPNGNWLLLNL